MTTSLGRLRSTSLAGGTPGAGIFAISPWRNMAAGGAAPPVPGWILATGKWNDAGTWDDTASWKDS